MRQLVATLFCLIAAASSLSNEARPLLFIYDSSNSMWGELADGSRKYEAGRRALAAAVRGLHPDQPIALRAYGHRSADSCEDLQLIVPFDAAGANGESIVREAESLRPTGKTPIRRSLAAGLADLGSDGGDILLVTDGIETCDADPCELVSEWRKAEVAVRVHVVGVGLSSHERDATQCLSEQTGGTYRDADSEAAFTSALSEISQSAAKREATFALKLRAIDEQGEERRASGTVLALDTPGAEALPIRSDGRTPLPGPGRYVVEAGVTLKTGEPYTTSRVEVEVTQPGEKIAELIVAAPASVSATFTQAGEPHPGALITAWQGEREIFKWRPRDTAFAAPGAYRFTSNPEADNALEQRAVLTAGEHHVVDFQLVRTVNLKVRLTLPDGSRDTRVVELYQDGEQQYRFHGGHGTQVRPGRYEILSPDPALPLTPQTITVGQEDTVLDLGVEAGFVILKYEGNPDDFVGNANRGNLIADDRKARIYLPVDTPVAVSPGSYSVQPHDPAGYFEPVGVTVTAGQTTEAVIQAKPTGALIVRYQPDNRYTVTPDRAFVYPLEGQPVIRSFLNPGRPVRLLPGRYRVEGWGAVGDITVEEVEISARQTAEVELSLSN